MTKKECTLEAEILVDLDHGSALSDIYLQNLCFSNNDNDDKTDKSYKTRPVTKDLNKVFPESLSNSPFQSVDEYTCKFRGRFSMTQYIKEQTNQVGLLILV